MGELITIVKGSDRTFYADLSYPDTDEPINLTSVQEITASFPGDDGTPVEVSLADGGISVLGAPGAGRISIEIGDEDTADLLVDPSPNTHQDLQVVVLTAEGDTVVCILPNVLSIKDPSYPLA